MPTNYDLLQEQKDQKILYLYVRITIRHWQVDAATLHELMLKQFEEKGIITWSIDPVVGKLWTVKSIDPIDYSIGQGGKATAGSIEWGGHFAETQFRGRLPVEKFEQGSPIVRSVIDECPKLFQVISYCVSRRGWE